MVCNTICRAGGIIYDEDKTHILLVLNRMSHSKNENKWYVTLYVEQEE